MKRPEFFAAFRLLVDDQAQPPLWSDGEVQRYLDDAQREAAERARLIRDSTTAAVCSIAVLANQAAYTLHASVLHVERAKLASGRTVLELSSTEALDLDYPGWETQTGAPSHLLIDAEGTGFKATLVPKPTQATTLSLVVFRTPLESLNSDDDTSEIAVRFHERLLDWMARCAFMKRDTETLNEPKAKEFEARFAAAFGERIDANAQRKQADRRRSQVAFRELG